MRNIKKFESLFDGAVPDLLDVDLQVLNEINDIISTKYEIESEPVSEKSIALTGEFYIIGSQDVTIRILLECKGLGKFILECKKDVKDKNGMFYTNSVGSKTYENIETVEMLLNRIHEDLSKYLQYFKEISDYMNKFYELDSQMGKLSRQCQEIVDSKLTEI